MKLEICANSFNSALAAKNAGADQIELCTELSVGGITPSYGLLEKVTSELDIPVHVLIRPRSGNFKYNQAEIDTMLRDIAACKLLGCAGVVSGALTKDNDIDILTTSKLIHAAVGMEFTFHRAFDVCNDPQQELQNLIDLGVTRLLSSGQQKEAANGIDLLKELLKISENKIQIMPGGRITSENIHQFKEVGFPIVHSSASKKRIPKAKSPVTNVTFEAEIMSISDEKLIREMMQLIS